jgi:hypothetical protein
LKLHRFVAIAAAFSLAALCAARSARAAGAAPPLDVVVDCHCPDVVGQKFCAALKDRIGATKSFHLATAASGLGMAVHVSSIDMWRGINDQLIDRMSAISVAFTIFSDQLPGEIYEDSSVFRVGIDATGEMSGKIVAALSQIETVNAVSLAQLRAAAKHTAH